LLEKNTKAGKMHICTNEKCDYKSAVESVGATEDKADEITAVF
jgi:hypothetical protein